MQWLIKILRAFFNRIKIARLKIGNSFEPICLDFSKYPVSWILMLLGTITSVVVIVTGFMSLSKTAIFPNGEGRYDIDTIYVGQMKDFCPKEFAANPGRKQFESCVPKLDINKMVEVKIPTFKETLKTAPILPYLMKNSTDPKLQKAREYFKSGNWFVIGIKVPEQYFRVDGGYIKDGKMDKKAVDYNVLTFRGMRFGTGCVNDECSDRIHVATQNLSQIPLLTSENSNENTVWIFGLENESPMGIWLDDGVFVTSKSLIHSPHRLYSFFAYGRQMSAAMAFIALFVVSFSLAYFFRRFSDYPAFSYFAGSTALWFFSTNFMTLFPWLRGTTYRLFSIWIMLNFLLSVLALNFAYARFKHLLKKEYIVRCHLAILALTFFAYLYFKDLGAIVAVWGRLEAYFALIVSVCAVAPLLVGIYNLTKMLKHKKDTRESTRLDYERRRTELLIYFFVWAAFCSCYVYFAFKGLGTGNIFQFFSISIVLFLSLLGVMLYYTYSKEMTHITSDPFAEIERLYRRMGVKEFCEHVKKHFEGVLVVLDMANSTCKDGYKKKEAMESLLDSYNSEANKHGYYANFAKPAGDDWKILFVKKEKQSLADDLYEITKFSVDNFYQFEKGIKDTFNDSSIHIGVFALSKYEVYINPNQAVNYGYRAMLDFSSPEADLMLKYVEKSKISNTIMVSGNRNLFGENLKDLLLENKTNDLKDVVLEKHKDFATELDIVYGLGVIKKD